jgi:hypothetical protein
MAGMVTSQVSVRNGAEKVKQEKAVTSVA